MIWLAIIIELAIQQWPDAGILLIIQFANGTLGWYETVKAADAVAALKAALKPLATVQRDGKWQNIDASLLVPGDLVLLASGSAIPADCIVNDGRIEVDQSALTGESLPVTMFRGDSPKMGSTVTRGEVEATVESTGSKTFFGKTATLLSGDVGLGHLQRLLLQIMVVLVVMSLTLCLTALFYLIWAEGVSFKKALSFAVVLLVASIPIAIEIVSTTTLALGSRQLAKHGAIVSRLQSIEEMAGVNLLCSDKTGTLTQNRMEIQDYCPMYAPQYVHTTHDVIKYAALAAKWKEPAKDALDTMIFGAIDPGGEELRAYTMLEHTPFDPVIKRTESKICHPQQSQQPQQPEQPQPYEEEEEEFRVTKGAPQVVASLLDLSIEGNDLIRDRVDAEVRMLASRGIRSLAVARTNKDDKWVMLGVMTFLDPPRPDTKATIEAALEKGVDVKMITGDQVLIAKEMSRMLGLGTNIKDASALPSLGPNGQLPPNMSDYVEMILDADGFAQVYPEHKYLIVAALREQGFAVGMTGDGVNDAPALKKADVGIAVAGATDAARAAADIVLTEPGLSVVIHAIVVARCIFQRVKNFINYRIAATMQLLLFFFITVFAFKPSELYCSAQGRNAWLLGLGINGTAPPVPNPIFEYKFLFENPTNLTAWEFWTQPIYENYCPVFFSLPVILLMLITVLNDGTLISVGYDNVTPSPRPEKWNLRVLFLISAILGLVSCGSSLLLVWAALDAPAPNSFFHRLGLPVPDYGQVVMMIYLKVSLSDFLTLFSARTTPGPFYSQKPGTLLFFAALLSLALSTTLACVWPSGHVDEVATLGLARSPLYYSARVDPPITPDFQSLYPSFTGCQPGAGTPPGALDPCTWFAPDYYSTYNPNITVTFPPGTNSDPSTTKNESYTLWALWIWLYCLVWWIIQDLVKVLCCHFIFKFDIFQARTAALVNLRGAARLEDRKLAGKAVGKVEMKYLGKKMDAAIAKVEEIARKTTTATTQGGAGDIPPAAVQRVSMSLGLARTSLSRVSAVSSSSMDGGTGTGGTGVDVDVAAQMAMRDVNAAAQAMAPYVGREDHAELQRHLNEVNRAAANLQRVSAVLSRVSATSSSGGAAV